MTKSNIRSHEHLFAIRVDIERSFVADYVRSVRRTGDRSTDTSPTSRPSMQG